ncbi:hypothetical protein [Streptomyces sp. NBC_00842]|uniref:hypothetical protein n=1 Tax=Streptomyces sp. NBC_00842 TaxID=2975848 RepID=UPI002F90A265|nr:hypothetical protein OH821_45400 [Streptomyces sp. NBC_00842]
MSALTAEQRGDLAEDMLPVAAHLAVLVHGDGGPEDVQEVLESLDEAQRNALIVVLAGLVDPEQPMGKALGWLDSDEHGTLTVPHWDDRTPLRDFAPEPQLEDEDLYVDPVAVRNYQLGRPGAVLPQERLQAVVDGVRRGMTYPDFDRMHGLSRGSTSTFISRTRRAFAARGDVFPDMVPVSALTVEQVVAMRKRYAAGGVTDLELAMSYGVNQQTVAKVLSGDTHRDAGGPIRAKRGSKPSPDQRVGFAGGTPVTNDSISVGEAA